MDINARFCNILLQQARKDLTGREIEHFDAHAHAVRVDRRWFLFEWPGAHSTYPGQTFSLDTVEADNVAHAKAQGINEWLDKHAVALRAQGWPPRDIVPKRR